MRGKLCWANELVAFNVVLLPYPRGIQSVWLYRVCYKYGQTMSFLIQADVLHVLTYVLIHVARFPVGWI